MDDSIGVVKGVSKDGDFHAMFAHWAPVEQGLGKTDDFPTSVSVTSGFGREKLTTDF